MTISERDAKILRWKELQTALAFIKDEEMKLRKELASYVLQEEKIEAFSKTLKLGNGYGMKATNVLNYTLAESELVLNVIDELSNAKLERWSEVFKFKPSLSESVYKTLPPEAKIIVDQVVTCKVGSPKLEMIVPKEAK